MVGSAGDLLIAVRMIRLVLGSAIDHRKVECRRVGVTVGTEVNTH